MAWHGMACLPACCSHAMPAVVWCGVPWPDGWVPWLAWQVVRVCHWECMAALARGHGRYLAQAALETLTLANK